MRAGRTWQGLVILLVAVGVGLSPAAASAAPRTHLGASWPGSAHRTTRTKFTGRVTGWVPRGTRVALQVRSGRRFRTVASSGLGRRGSYTLWWKTPASGASAPLRLVVTHGRQTLTTSSVHNLKLTAVPSSGGSTGSSGHNGASGSTGATGGNTGGGTGGNTGGNPGGGTVGQVSTPFDAQAIAEGVRNAATDSDRISALDKLFGAIGAGVRDTNLGVIVAGGETSASDAYVYDSEVQLLSDQLARNSRISFDELAEILDGVGLTKTDAQCPNCGLQDDQLTGSDVQSLVMQAVQAGTGGSDQYHDYLQLIRNLEPQSGSDLSQPVATDAEVIDPVQQLLITVLLTAGGQQVQSNFAPRRSPAYMEVSHDSAPCSFQSAGHAQGWVEVAKGAAALVGSAIADGLSEAVAVTDVAHATILGVSVHLSALTPTLSGAYGQNGPRSASVMDFKVHLEMLDQLPQGVINCGALAGYTFPNKGPIPNIKVDWHLGGLYNLGPDINNYGKPICQSGQTLCTLTTTDSSGDATLQFQPFYEYVPGAGPVRTARGGIDADAYTLTGTGSTYGKVSEGLGATKFVKLGFAISWHQPRGYQIPDQTVSWTETQHYDDGPYIDKYTFSLHNEVVCLGKDVPLEGNPVEPPQNYDRADTGITEAFGTSSAKTDPDYSYATGTDSYSAPNPGGNPDPQTGDNVLQPTGPAPLPAQFSQDDENQGWVGETFLDSPFGHGLKVLGMVSFDGGSTASTSLEFFPQPNPDTNTKATVSPDHFFQEAQWSEATSCPAPQLPSGVT